MFVTCQSTANGCDLELHLTVPNGVGDETFHVLANTIQGKCLDVFILGRNSEAIPVMTVRLTPLSTFLFHGIFGCTSTMYTKFIGSENKHRHIDLLNASKELQR